MGEVGGRPLSPLYRAGRGKGGAVGHRRHLHHLARGVRPEWVYIGKSDDLAATFRELAGNKDIRKYDLRGGLFVSWALIREEYRNGALRFLNDSMKPLVPSPDIPGGDVTPIPVIGPLTKYKEIVGDQDKDPAAPTPRA